MSKNLESKWSETEDIIIAHTMLNQITYNTDRTAAIDEISKKINRTFHAIEYRWYNKVRPKYKEEIKKAKINTKKNKDIQPLKKLIENKDGYLENEKILLDKTDNLEENTIDELTFDKAIEFLNSLKNKQCDLDIEQILKENERLKIENQELKDLQKKYDLLKEDYEILLKVMNRARTMFDESKGESSSRKFKMSKNGNLETI